MSYRLKTREPIATGLRRIAREQLQSAMLKISEALGGEEAEAVHATRKHIKKARALLRLVREGIGDEIYKEENCQLGEVARSLSGSRDARVRLEVVRRLASDCEQEENVFRQTIALLEEAIASVIHNFAERQRDTVTALERICDRIEGWPLDHLAIGDLCCALKESYRRGRKTYRTVSSEPTTENFHTWRKRVKEIWYQARILRNLNRIVLGEMAKATDALGEHLGDLHDLAFLRAWLEATEQIPEEECSLLLGLICIREGELETVALDLGARFFAEKPGAFERRTLRYGREWPASPAIA